MREGGLVDRQRTNNTSELALFSLGQVHVTVTEIIQSVRTDLVSFSAFATVT